MKPAATQPKKGILKKPKASTTSTTSDGKGKADPERRARVEAAVRARVDADKKTFQIQERLLESNVSEAFLKQSVCL